MWHGVVANNTEEVEHIHTDLQRADIFVGSSGRVKLLHDQTELMGIFKHWF